jgi:hypothetical protein
MAAVPWARAGEDRMLVLGRILVGFLLLVLGRRLYWLFVAAVGFLYGLELAPRLLPGQSQAVIVIIALGLALLGALLAVVATKVALGLTGFVAAGGIAAVVLQHLTIESGVVALGIYFIAGIIGAVLFLLLFNAALIVLSSLAGAYLVVLGAEEMRLISPAPETALIIVLAVVGIVIQARPWRTRKPPP